MKIVAAVGVAAGLFFVGACASDSPSSAPQSTADSTSASPAESESASNEPSEVEPTPEVITYADVVSGPITNAEICASYADLIDRYTSVVAKRTKSLDGKSNDPYKAAKFVGNNGWVYEDLSVGFNEDWESAATEALNAVSNGQAGTVESLDDYRRASLEACGLDEDYETLRSDVSVVDSDQSSVLSAAEEKPWYPKGYEEWVDGVAFKYNASATRNSYLCGWAYNVVCRDGCPNGLYVEVNFEDGNGTIVDYGNDYIAQLLPGDKALVQLRVGSRCGNVDSFSVTEVNCR